MSNLQHEYHDNTILQNIKSFQPFSDIKWRFSLRANFETAMNPQMLLQSAHYLFLNNFIHIGSGLIFICRVTFHLRGLKTVTKVISFPHHCNGQHGGARQLGQHIGAVRGGDVFNREKRNKETAFRTVVLVMSKPNDFSCFNAPTMLRRLFLPIIALFECIRLRVCTHSMSGLLCGR